tara:strand:- start:684 stop:1094 length:411 start_codon:yes stop_codon:yes gene_type:complete
MKGQKVYDCKRMCKELGETCHNTKNRVIEKMCVCEKKDCKMLADYLQCLMVIECLCDYICLCACEHEEVTSSILSELTGKCTKIMGCIDKLMKNFDDKHCSYLNCAPIKKMCMSCKSMKSGKTKKSRKSKKSRSRR